MRIPLIDLKGQYVTLNDEINEAIQNGLDSSIDILGSVMTSKETIRAIEGVHCGK